MACCSVHVLQDLSAVLHLNFYVSKYIGHHFCFLTPSFELMFYSFYSCLLSLIASLSCLSYSGQSPYPHVISHLCSNLMFPYFLPPVVVVIVIVTITVTVTVIIVIVVVSAVISMTRSWALLPFKNSTFLYQHSGFSLFFS